MIVVRTQQNVLVFQYRITTLEDPNHVSVTTAEVLEITAIIATSAQTGRREVLHEIVARGSSSRSSRVATFQLIVGQDVHVGLEFARPNGIQGTKQNRFFGGHKRRVRGDKNCGYCGKRKTLGPQRPSPTCPMVIMFV